MIIELNSLQGGLPGVSKAMARYFAEAAKVCFDYHDHTSGVDLQLEGTTSEFCTVFWTGKITGQLRRGWDDMTKTTEEGATAIAILLVLELTPWTVIRRARKKTGFDYWLGERGESRLILNDTARLEVSGILSSGAGEFRRRVRMKKAQTKQTDDTGLPAYVAVIEFGRPKGWFGEK